MAQRTCVKKQFENCLAFEYLQLVWPRELVCTISKTEIEAASVKSSLVKAQKIFVLTIFDQCPFRKLI